MTTYMKLVQRNCQIWTKLIECSHVPQNEPSTMTRSCIESAVNHDNQDPTIIRMTSSAIADSVIANNPVYTFKQYAPGSTSASASPAKIRVNRFNDNYSTTCQTIIDTDAMMLDQRIGNMATLRPYPHRGLLLNNNCYELASSELVNAILDRDRESLHSRLFSSNAPSAFKPLIPGTKSRQAFQGPICNNHCYNSVLVAPLNASTINYGYNRQISAPSDSSNDNQMKMLYNGKIALLHASMDLWAAMIITITSPLTLRVTSLSNGYIYSY